MLSKLYYSVQRQSEDPVVPMPFPTIRTWITLKSIHELNEPEQAWVLTSVLSEVAKGAIAKHDEAETACFGLQDLRSGVRHVKYNEPIGELDELDLYGLACRMVSDPNVKLVCGSPLLFFITLQREHVLPLTLKCE